ncbi:hypothetical protein AVEN_96431-1 [Araneus ventricosus]|uniref:Uncharacterized protein n=1 Tax=Araneus ventricosus TaxID=182803 RepID=A0A4Y2HWL7_ARAVE|nr:hypothetical protein AVEN_96431-1 [Araneus ventricosus]
MTLGTFMVGADCLSPLCIPSNSRQGRQGYPFTTVPSNLEPKVQIYTYHHCIPSDSDRCRLLITLPQTQTQGCKAPYHHALRLRQECKATYHPVPSNSGQGVQGYLSAATLELPGQSAGATYHHCTLRTLSQGVELLKNYRKRLSNHEILRVLCEGIKNIKLYMRDLIQIIFWRMTTIKPKTLIFNNNYIEQ